MSKQQILNWFDPDMPTDLPDHVVDKLLDGFWTSEVAHRGLTDEVYATNGPEGWNVRLDTLSRRMWYATPLTVAKYRAASRLDLTPPMKAKLRPWQLAAWEAERAERAEVKATAIAKADALLSTLVSEKQFEYYREYGEHMEASTLHPGKVYILHKGVLAGNIDVFDHQVPVEIEDEQVDRWQPRAVICSSPVERYPDADLIIAQILHIRADEETFLQLANLHHGQWSPEELKVRERRPFATVPRYDKAMGGWVNVPVDLTTGDCEYDLARKREEAEASKELEDRLTEQWAIWSEELPQAVIDDFRARMGRVLRPDPETTRLLNNVEGVEHFSDLFSTEPKQVADIEDVDIALSFVRRWLNRAVAGWLRALGHEEEELERDTSDLVLWMSNEDEEMQAAPLPTLEEARRAPIVGARRVRSLDDSLPSLSDLAGLLSEGQEAFELVDGPAGTTS